MNALADPSSLIIFRRDLGIPHDGMKGRHVESIRRIGNGLRFFLQAQKLALFVTDYWCIGRSKVPHGGG